MKQSTAQNTQTSARKWQNEQ